MFFRVLSARATPSATASSKLFVDDEITSVTFAIDMYILPVCPTKLIISDLELSLAPLKWLAHHN